MAEDPAHVLETVWTAWRAGHLTSVASNFSAAGVYSEHIPLDIWPWAGVTVGRQAIVERLTRVVERFEVIEYEGHITSADDAVARGRVWFLLVHRASGHEFDGHVRHEATVRDGVIVQLEAFYDVERLRAFMRLAAAMA